MESYLVPTSDVDKRDRPIMRMEITNRGECYRVCCPFCEDQRKRLWINHMWGYRDPKTGSKNLWLAKCFNENCLSDNRWNRNRLYDMVYDDVGYGQNAQFDKLRFGQRRLKELVVAEAPGLLKSLQELGPNHPAWGYLVSRGY